MEKPTVKEETFLQCILGVDKRNPSITVYRDLSEGKLHVYYGHELFEVVGDDREQVEFKLLVGRLYNAGLKKGRLQRHLQDNSSPMSGFGGKAAAQGRIIEWLLTARSGHSAEMAPEECRAPRGLTNVRRFVVSVDESSRSYPHST